MPKAKSWQWWDESTKNHPRPRKYDLAKLLNADGVEIFTMYGGAGDEALGSHPDRKLIARMIRQAPVMLELLKMTKRQIPYGTNQNLIKQIDELLKEVQP